MITAIVPVTKMAGRLQNMRIWLPEAHEVGMEILIIHDYRDLETQVELESICADFPNSRIFLHSEQFGSPGATRNFGLKQAKSKYVVFWDSDDLPKPKSFFNEVLKNEGNFDVLVGQYLTTEQSKNSNGSERSSDFNLYAFSYTPGLWRMVFLRELISDIEFGPMKMGEDQVFLGKCLKRVENITFSNTVFYEYFLGVEGQLTGSRKSRIELIDAFDEIISLRRDSEGNQYKYLSIVITRMWLTLAKIALIEKFWPEAIKKLFRREVFFSHRPIIQFKCTMYVWLRLIGLKII